MLPACREWQCTILSLYLVAGRGTGKIKSAGASHTHTHSPYFWQRRMRLLPSIALSRLKIIHTNTKHLLPWLAKVLLFPLEAVSTASIKTQRITLTEEWITRPPSPLCFDDIDGICIDPESLKRCKTEEGVLKNVKGFLGDYIESGKLVAKY